MTGGWLYTHGGEDHWLVYTADAYFTINERYGTDFVEKLRPMTRDAYDIAVGCLVILAEQGELCRRYMGHDPLPMLTEEDIRRTVLPDGIAPVKDAVYEAVLRGMRIEAEDENGKKSEPVDIGLLEYEKKTVVGKKR